MKPAAVKAAIRSAYEDTAAAVVAACASRSLKDGACVVAALVVDATVYIANLGDSKVLSA